MKDAFWQIAEKSEAGAEKFWYTHEQKLWRICHTILDCSCAPKIQMEILHRYHLSALNCSLLQGAARGSEPFWPERLEARGDGAFDCKGSILLDSWADEGPLHAAVCNVFTYLSGVLTCTHLSECGVEGLKGIRLVLTASHKGQFCWLIVNPLCLSWHSEQGHFSTDRQPMGFTV